MIASEVPDLNPAEPKGGAVEPAEDVDAGRRVMADDISLQKNTERQSPKRERRDKWWNEGYKAGTINAPLPDDYTPSYLAGYEKGLDELQRLMNLSDGSEGIVRPWSAWSPLPDFFPKSERPPNLDKWVAYVMSHDCKARCILKREDMLVLLRYMDRLEHELAEERQCV